MRMHKNDMRLSYLVRQGGLHTLSDMNIGVQH
ncbi:uncharacterized protein METZ01_LOCUS83546 [marine metagenome]|uniref:Uncharacterized protein n=1 Tax=marine metagenome TaxID=408172 RepID=A0A381UR87_9ZZZZ